MNQNSTPAKFLAILSLILIITLNTQAQNSIAEIESENILIVNNSDNSYYQEKPLKNVSLDPKNCVMECLPVKFILFEGKMTKNSLVLNWITTEEINNNYFEVERSFNGNEFTQIGYALDGFENGTKKEYAFKDYSNLLKNKQIVYYRLKQIDNDNKFSYSENVVVQVK